MITKRGSQNREPIEDTSYVILKTWPQVDLGHVVLRDADTGRDELWVKRDDYAGYVIEINGRGYEFVRGL
jgi:hypothetical protein